VNDFDGALKAEHGTGRNMAPFLELEWGSRAVGYMREIKKLFDPDGILNPEVILSEDPVVHLKNIKAIPEVDAQVDPCIECGFCEVWCPSRDLTLTPRQRIVLERERLLLESSSAPSDTRAARRIKKDYQYLAVDTCAVDGLCALGCPVGIDTGALMKKYRHDRHGILASKIATKAAQEFQHTVRRMRQGLGLMQGLAALIPPRQLEQATLSLRRITKRTPAWNADFPGPAPSLPELDSTGAEVVYFPSCLSRSLAPISGSPSVPQMMQELATKAGLKLRYPLNLPELCCGMPFSSKGFPEANRRLAEKVVDNLWISSQQGLMPIVQDTSPCSYQLKHYDQVLEGDSLARWQQLKIYDLVEFLDELLLPRLSLTPLAEKVVLHPTCSTEKMGLRPQMVAVAQKCATEVVIPQHWGCCAFAGDRGLLVPELTASATQREAAEVESLQALGHYSVSRTCEVGMTHATGHNYENLLRLVYKAALEAEK